MSRVEGKMSRVEGKCRGFKNVGIFWLFKKKKRNKQNKTKQNKNTERKKIKKYVVPAPGLEPPPFWLTMRAPYHCATKPTLEFCVKISLLNPLRVTSRIFQEGARFFEHEVKSTRLYSHLSVFTPKQTPPAWVHETIPPASWFSSNIGFFGLKPHSSSPPTRTTIFSEKKFVFQFTKCLYTTFLHCNSLLTRRNRINNNLLLFYCHFYFFKDLFLNEVARRNRPHNLYRCEIFENLLALGLLYLIFS